MPTRRSISYALVSFCTVVFVVSLAVAQTQEKVTGAEVRKEVTEAAEKTKAFASQQAETYSKEMQAKLDALSKKIDELKERAKTAKGEAQAKSQPVIADLQAKMDAARKKLTDVGAAGAETWKDVKAGFDKVMDDLNKAFDEAFGKSK